MLTTVAADTAFDQVPLTAFANNGSSITVALPGANAPQNPRGINITNGGADDLNPGDLLMLVKGSASALVQITRIVNQQVFFDAGDSLVPVLSVGLGDDTPARIVDVAPRVLAHFGVEAPPYTLRRAA